jgi:Gas vesicle protein K
MTRRPADKVLEAPRDLERFERDAGRLGEALSRRLDADPENAERGLAQLVLTVVELLRQIVERQALRRVEAGGLDDETVERLGRTLMALEARMEQLKEVFGFDDEDLNIDLGPLGRLL